MPSKSLPLLAALLGLALMPATANAGDAYEHAGKKVWEPYTIEKTCADGRYDCRVRMIYARGQNSMAARPGSYWYRKPFQAACREDAKCHQQPGQYGY